MQMSDMDFQFFPNGTVLDMQFLNSLWVRGKRVMITFLAVLLATIGSFSNDDGDAEAKALQKNFLNSTLECRSCGMLIGLMTCKG